LTSKSNPIKKGRSFPTTTQRLDRIESSLKDLEESLLQTKKQLATIDRIKGDLDEIKQHTSQKPSFSIFGRKRRTRKKEEKSPAIQAAESPSTSVTDLIQNPMVQSFLKRQGKSAGKLGAGMDISQMLSLMQNPTIQSFFNKSKEGKKGTRSKKKDKGFDLLQVLKLMNDPAIQSMFKK
jgi:hypothetical protein